MLNSFSHWCSHRVLRDRRVHPITMRSDATYWTQYNLNPWSCSLFGLVSWRFIVCGPGYFTRITHSISKRSSCSFQYSFYLILLSSMFSSEAALGWVTELRSYDTCSSFRSLWWLCSTHSSLGSVCFCPKDGLCWGRTLHERNSQAWVWQLPYSISCTLHTLLLLISGISEWWLCAS